jgi:hypothetical protein
MSSNVPHERRVGDTAKKYPFVCKYLDENNEVAFRDLTGATVTLTMVNAATGVEKVSAAMAAIVDAINGRGEYTFVSADVDTAGIYWVTINVTVGADTDSYPVEPDDAPVWIHSSTQTAKQAYQTALMA